MRWGNSNESSLVEIPLVAETLLEGFVLVNLGGREIMHVFKIYRETETDIMTTVSEYTATEWIIACEMQGCDFDYFYMIDPE
jgi:hypothetical protein